jgi:hypothetical protein
VTWKALQLLLVEDSPADVLLIPEIPWEVVSVVADEKVGNLDDTVTSSGMLYVTTYR